MRKPSNRSTVFIYVTLAAGSVFLGTILTYILVLGAAYFDIDLSINLWLLAVPSTLSLALNVLFVELYKQLSRK